MSATGFALFDTAIGACGIAWGPRGIVGVQLPEADEGATRERMAAALSAAAAKSSRRPKCSGPPHPSAR